MTVPDKIILSNVGDNARAVCMIEVNQGLEASWAELDGVSTILDNDVGTIKEDFPELFLRAVGKDSPEPETSWAKVAFFGETCFKAVLAFAVWAAGFIFTVVFGVVKNIKICGNCIVPNLFPFSRAGKIPFPITRIESTIEIVMGILDIVNGDDWIIDKHHIVPRERSLGDGCEAKNCFSAFILEYSNYPTGNSSV